MGLINKGRGTIGVYNGGVGNFGIWNFGYHQRGLLLRGLKPRIGFIFGIPTLI